MGLFRRKPKETFLCCSLCGRPTNIPASKTADAPCVCPDCRQLERLQNANAAIVDIDRRSGGPERTLTVLFFDSAIGYFCIQQSCGAYTGLGLRYLIFPRNGSVSKAADYAEHDGYSSWIPNRWFSEAFEMDIGGKKRLETVNIPKSLHPMRFHITMKQGGGRLSGGDGLIERFALYKNPYDEIRVRWSIGFGYAMGSHNPGAGGDDPVPSVFFLNNDLPAFAAYIAEKYSNFATYDEIFSNDEIKILFDLCAEEDHK